MGIVIYSSLTVAMGLITSFGVQWAVEMWRANELS